MGRLLRWHLETSMTARIPGAFIPGVNLIPGIIEIMDDVTGDLASTRAA